jgi:hypothetical protein
LRRDERVDEVREITECPTAELFRESTKEDRVGVDLAMDQGELGAVEGPMKIGDEFGVEVCDLP